MEDFKYKGNPITDERWLLLINETEEKYSKATGIHLIKNWDNQSFNDWFMVIDCEDGCKWIPVLFSVQTGLSDSNAYKLAQYANKKINHDFYDKIEIK